MGLILSQAIGGLSLIQMVIVAVVICGVVGILVVVARQTGVAIPPWAISIFWIVVVVIVAVFAIKLIASML